MEKTVGSKQDEGVQLWEGFIYLAFFIFSNLFILPNMPKQLRINYYQVEMLLYGAVGVFTGIAVYRVIKDSPEWVKILIVSILYLLIVIRLITNWELFTIAGN